MQVGASPEMYVRVQGGRVETCPISGQKLQKLFHISYSVKRICIWLWAHYCESYSVLRRVLGLAGTIERGKDPLEDAHQVRTLLNSSKDESELTM